MYRYETHCHTAPVSQCANASPEDTVRFYKRLDYDGIFLFDLNTAYKYEQLLADHTFAENREDRSFIWENEFDAEEGLNYDDLTLYIKEGETYRRYEEEHVQKAYDQETVERLLTESGLEVLGVLDAETLSEPREDSERVYYIAREITK